MTRKTDDCTLSNWNLNHGTKLAYDIVEVLTHGTPFGFGPYLMQHILGFWSFFLAEIVM